MFICKLALLALGIAVTALTATPSGAHASATPAVASSPATPAS